MPIKLVVFDLDGTLVDSAPATIAILNQLRHERGLVELPVHVFIPWLSLGGTGLMSNALELTTTKQANTYLQEFRKRAKLLDSDAMWLYAGVEKTLDTLHKQNIKMAVCTSKARALMIKLFDDFDISNYFDTTIAGGDLDTSKPDPENLLICLRRLNIDIKDAIFVGDSTVDQQTALNAQIKFAFHEHGYDDGVDKTKADIVFSNYKTLVEKVLSYE